MRKINTLAELRAEQKALRFHKTYLETEMKNEFAELKKDLAPLKMLTKGVGKTLSSESNGIIGNSFGNIAEFLTKNILLRNSGFISRMIVPFLAKNTAKNFAEDHKPEIVEKITNFITRFLKKEEKETVEV